MDEQVAERAGTARSRQDGGQHLLESRTASSASLLAWPTLDGKMLTGFSQGAADIVLCPLATVRGHRKRGTCYQLQRLHLKVSCC